MQKKISHLLIKKYLEIKRDLPWREISDPYKIWLSEVILQQTRVAQGLPYYISFVNRFPNVAELASADEDEVLKLWQGLGYYSRARNMLSTAKDVVQRFNGVFPSAYKELISLKGIGDYTASAIASFSSKEPVAVVDGNVIRVLSRMYALDLPVHSSEGKKLFKSLAVELLDTSQPDLHNQAIMELGALICKPRNPICSECPVSHVCVAFYQNTRHDFPVKKQKKELKNRYLVYAVIDDGNAICIEKRDHSEIWRGLYQFPLMEFLSPPDEKRILAELTSNFNLSENELVSLDGPVIHKLSHQRLHVSFAHFKVKKMPIIEGSTAVDLSDIGKYAFPAVLVRYIEKQITW